MTPVFRCSSVSDAVTEHVVTAVSFSGDLAELAQELNPFLGGKQSELETGSSSSLQLLFHINIPST